VNQRSVSYPTPRPLLFHGHGYGFRCTRHVSLQRCHDMTSPSLHGVPRDGSPASAILWDAPTPRRPSRPVRVLHEPIPSFSPVVCSPRSWASHRGPGSCRFRSPHPDLRWKRRGLSGSLETLVVIVRALRPLAYQGPPTYKSRERAEWAHPFSQAICAWADDGRASLVE